MQPEVKSGPPDPPRVSVIVPILNPGPDTLRTLVAALRSQERVTVEVVIVDSSSTDGSADLQVLADVWISIPRAEFDHGGTRNLAARQAMGDVLVFMTQDARPCDALTLSRLVAPVVAGSVQAAYARQVAPASAPLLERIARDLNYPTESAVRSLDDVPRMGIRAYMLPNVASTVRRAMFESHGGFPESVVFNEDVQFANAILANGGRIAYVAAATVEHGHTYTLMGLLRRYFDNGASLAEAPEPLRSVATDGAGAGFAMRQARAAVAAGRAELLPRWALETAAKWVGFRLGRRYRWLPVGWRPWLSLQPEYHKRRVT